MSVVDHIENQVYRMIDEFTLSDEQTEELFLKFANALPTYSVTPAGIKELEILEEDFKAGGGTD
tara:strand:- start:227 stop:418 length:192 start_codon:yes stop_codon:yes gene_type:complete